jgi:hypothetical protein
VVVEDTAVVAAAAEEEEEDMVVDLPEFREVLQAVEVVEVALTAATPVPLDNQVALDNPDAPATPVLPAPLAIQVEATLNHAHNKLLLLANNATLVPPDNLDNPEPPVTLVLMDNPVKEADKEPLDPPDPKAHPDNPETPEDPDNPETLDNQLHLPLLPLALPDPPATLVPLVNPDNPVNPHRAADKAHPDPKDHPDPLDQPETPVPLVNPVPLDNPEDLANEEFARNTVPSTVECSSKMELADKHSDYAVNLLQNTFLVLFEHFLRASI